jgi:hypothetical protein
MLPAWAVRLMGMKASAGLSGAMLLLAVFAAPVGCKHSAPTLGPDALFVKVDDTTLGWSVDPDDHVRVALAASSAPEGTPLSPLPKEATGTLVYKSPDGTSKTVPMTVQDGMLVASGPPLTADLNEVNYTIIPGAPVPGAHAALGVPGAHLALDGLPPPRQQISGTLYIPPGGTAPLVADAKATVGTGSGVAVAVGKTGPHGGVVQVVGGDPVEIVSTKDGTVRAYILSSDLAQPVVVGDRKVTLGVVAERPETVVLVPDPSLHYFVGHWHVHGNPLGITVHVNAGGHPHVAIVGYRPGAVVVVGVGAPVVRVAVVERWDDVDVRWWPRASVNVNVGFFGVEDEDHEGDHDHGRHRGWDHDRDEDHDRGWGLGHGRK